MVTDQQVRKLMKLIQSEETLTIAAAKSGMDEKTARKYRQSGRFPSQCQPEHSWQTRPDPFGDCWQEIQELLKSNPGFEAKTIFADLQRRYPGRFQDGQLRTLQRKMKRWRAISIYAMVSTIIFIRQIPFFHRLRGGLCQEGAGAGGSSCKVGNFLKPLNSPKGLPRPLSLKPQLFEIPPLFPHSIMLNFKVLLITTINQDHNSLML
jgi:hypothetical protein